MRNILLFTIVFGFWLYKPLKHSFFRNRLLFKEEFILKYNKYYSFMFIPKNFNLIQQHSYIHKLFYPLFDLGSIVIYRLL